MICTKIWQLYHWQVIHKMRSHIFKDMREHNMDTLYYFWTKDRRPTLNLKFQPTIQDLKSWNSVLKHSVENKISNFWTLDIRKTPPKATQHHNFEEPQVNIHLGH